MRGQKKIKKKWKERRTKKLKQTSLHTMMNFKKAYFQDNFYNWNKVKKLLKQKSSLSQL
jgi:hypothetical protein